MTKDELISACRQLLGKGKLKECFILLDKNIIQTRPISDMILLIQGRYENNQRLANVGVNNMIGSEVNAINYSLLETIKQIKDEDIAVPVIEADNYRILIICLNSDDEFYMRAFCTRMSIPNCEVKQLKEYEEPTDYDLIIFDNHSLKQVDGTFVLNNEEIAHLNLMEEYIKEYSDHKKYMIHFGDNSKIVSDNREVIYSGNSKFALYSRIQEMIQYIGKDRLYKK